MESHFHIKSTQEKVIFGASVVFILASLVFDGYIFWLNRAENIALKNEVAELENLAGLVQANLNKTRIAKSVVEGAVQNEKQINVSFQDQIQGIVGTVSVLEKLSKTDTELLKKYSKVYFLNENYIPEKLTVIDLTYLLEPTRTLQIHEKISAYLKNMLDSAKNEGIEIKIASAYRSFGEQASIKSNYKVTYGAGTANKFSADQGYSEHQLERHWTSPPQKSARCSLVLIKPLLILGSWATPTNTAL